MNYYFLHPFTFQISRLFFNMFTFSQFRQKTRENGVNIGKIHQKNLIYYNKTHELLQLQIRGVASKQLVNDAVVSVSGRPLSYEQVLCRLPRLEIHELSDDFDLKDNTDHTQLLVKISLEYSQNGGRSAPLDLLLYDSLCWDCSIDGCQANTKENKCFFATGTSALQIFRIGRTIATRVSPGNVTTSAPVSSHKFW